MPHPYLTAAASLLIATAASAQTLPVAPVRNVSETFFGTQVDDPYRYMENIKDPEVAAWMKAQSDHAWATLKAIPGREAMYKNILKYDEAVSARIAGVARTTGDWWFYEKRGVNDDQFKLFARQGLNGPEKLLFDPEVMRKATGKPHAINFFNPSPDGRYVAYGVSAAGSEDAVMHIVDVQTGKAVGKPVDRAQFGAPSWAPDGKTLYLNRLQVLKPGMPMVEKYQRSEVFRMALGGTPATHAMFGLHTPGVQMTPAEIPFVGITHDGHWALGIVTNGVQREITVYVAPVKTINQAKPGWKKLFGAEAEITSIAYFDDGLYLLSNKGAPRSQVLHAPIGSFDLAKAEVVVPTSERVITGIAAAKDALYIEAREGNVKQLYKRGYANGAAIAPVALPVQGSFVLNEDESGASAANPQLPGVVLDLQGWNRARQIYTVAADGKVANTGLQPQGPYDAPDDVVATEVKVPSYDGALVPMSIIHKKGVVLDGNNPTLLYGYASYGITEEPYYSISRLAWLDAGGVYAIANPRGSSVYGQEWYKAGYQATKPNTWKDFIACAEYLINQKYTNPKRLGIMGGSAGGILVGRAMTERPDLFAAVIPAVGVLDAVRAEVTPNGVPNIPEFGTRTNEAGFKALLAMSTYHHVQPNTAYPAVLLTHGTNDPRVEVWHSTKTAARLMAATTSGKPILLRLDYQSGHGIGNTKSQVLQERADMFAFMLWQMGVPGYQLP